MYYPKFSLPYLTFIYIQILFNYMYILLNYKYICITICIYHLTIST